MTERILDFSTTPARLHVRNAQLCVTREGTATVSIPVAETAVIIVSHPQVTLTHAVLARLAEAGGALVTCDRRSLPVGMLLPLAAHGTQVERFAAQARASRPVCKRLWRQLVRSKILAQAAALESLGERDAGLRALIPSVRSGDPENIEGQAARRYWQRLFGRDFRRRRDGRDQNLLLNYGYAVLRAIVGRAICAAGLHP